jgi:hypothetical protein
MKYTHTHTHTHSRMHAKQQSIVVFIIVLTSIVEGVQMPEERFREEDKNWDHISQLLLA